MRFPNISGLLEYLQVISVDLCWEDREIIFGQ